MQRESTEDTVEEEDYSLISLEKDDDGDAEARDEFPIEESPLLRKEGLSHKSPGKQWFDMNGNTSTLTQQPPPPPRITSTYRRERYEHRKQIFACFLASFSGFADVLCYHAFG